MERGDDPIALARRNWEDAGWTGAIADGVEAVSSVIRAHQIVLGRIDAVLTPFHLSFARFELLRLLAFTQRGALSVSSASSRLQVHVSSVTHAIDRLQGAGLVQRQPHPTDRRSTLVSITQPGRVVTDQATAALNAVFADLGMSTTESRDLVAAIRSLRKAHGDL